MEFARTRARRLLAYAAMRDAQKQVSRAAGHGVRNIFTYTSVPELIRLFRLAKVAPIGTNAVEIGSHLGASTCYIAAAMAERGGMLYCIDTWNNETMPEGEQDTFAAFMSNTRRVSATIIPVRKRSEDLRETDVKKPIGFAFIDGDHSYEACLRDFQTIAPWISLAGIVAFHDAVNPGGPANFPGVQRVVGMAMESGRWQLGGNVESLCWINRLPE